MKASAAVVGGLLEETLKDHIGALQLEKGCRSTIRLISILKNKHWALNKLWSCLNVGS